MNKGIIVALLIYSGWAKDVKEGAFVNTFTDKKLCFSKKDMNKMQLSTWLEFMKSRGHTCNVTESDDQRWTALCDQNEYKLAFNTFGNRLLMDCKVSDSAGKIMMKKAFLGEYAGACDNDTPKVAIEDYFDLPSSASDTASTHAKESVGKDLIYCANVYHALSTKVKASKREALMQLGDAFMQEGYKLFGNHLKKAQNEVESTANSIAEKVVGATPEEMLKLSQSPKCKPFLKGDFDKNIDALIIKRDKTLSTK